MAGITEFPTLGRLSKLLLPVTAATSVQTKEAWDLRGAATTSDVFITRETVFAGEREIALGFDVAWVTAVSPELLLCHKGTLSFLSRALKSGAPTIDGIEAAK